MNTNPRSEHPKPQFQRDSWMNLNGLWAFEIDNGRSGKARGLNAADAQLSSQILVPFCPQSELSGVNHKDFLSGVWYRRTFELTKEQLSGRVALHFGAVDYHCEAFVNGVSVGTHTGGYVSFCFDVTEAVHEGENVITVYAEDDERDPLIPRGKQSELFYSHGCDYTRTTGIWQTVWLESTADNYVRSLRLTPDFDGKCLRYAVRAEDPAGARVTVLCGGRVVARSWADERGEGVCPIPAEHFRPWSPEDPYLYDLEVTLPSGDRVESYFGMRQFSVMEHRGRRVLALNHRPCFQSGLLDQGYWSDGLYTPPADEAMVWDIQTARDMGFSMLRKHIKIEPLRWYYHCDRLGMIVWQDMVSCFEGWRTLTMQVLPFLGLHLHDAPSARLGRAGEPGRQQFLRDMADTVDLLYNCVSLGLWVPFNEGWGQFSALEVADRLRAMDPTRPIDHASGWHDQGGGDLKSRHVYYRPVRLKNDGRRVLALTEFGGYSLQCPGHLATDKKFGYRMYDDAAAWMDAVEKLYETEVLPLIQAQGLSAAVYTQLSDVEDEVNGLVTFDRRVCKMDPARMRKINKKLHF